MLCFEQSVNTPLSPRHCLPALPAIWRPTIELIVVLVRKNRSSRPDWQTEMGKAYLPLLDTEDTIRLPRRTYVFVARARSV